MWIVFHIIQCKSFNLRRVFDLSYDLKVNNYVIWNMFVDVLVCRRFGLSTFWSVDVLVCRRFGLSTFWFVDVSVCRRFGLSTFRSVDVLVCRRFGLSTFRFVDVLVVDVSVCRRFDQLPIRQFITGSLLLLVLVSIYVDYLFDEVIEFLLLAWGHIFSIRSQYFIP